MSKMSRKNRPFFIRTEKDIILALRLIILVNLCMTWFFGGGSKQLSWYFWSVLGILAVSEVVFFFESSSKFALEKIWSWIFLFDTGVITLLIFFMGKGGTELFLTYALTIAIAAISKRASAAFIAAILTTAVYTALAVYGKTDIEFLSSSFMLRASFFFAMALFIGYLSERVEEERVSKARMEHVLKEQIHVKDKQVDRLIGYARNIIQSMINALIVTSPDGDIRIVNRAAIELLGYEEKDLIGQPITTVLVGEKLTIGEFDFDKPGKRWFVRDVERTFLAKGGRRIPVLLSSSILRDTDGGVEGIVCVGLDITDRKKAEDNLKKSHEELRNLSEHLQNIREEERARISREIHDELGHKLTALKMDLSWLGRETAELDDPSAVGKLEERKSSMTGLVDEIIQVVRKIAEDLRPGILDHLGLCAAIQWQAEDFEKRSGIDHRLVIPEDELTLNQRQVTGLFRIFQEILTNVTRHAQATAVDTKLERYNGEVTLEVRDNGKGIVEAEIFGSRSLGLLGMRERTHSLKGTLNIHGTCGKGTTVTVRIPVKG